VSVAAASAEKTPEDDYAASEDDEFPTDEVLRLLRRQARALTAERRALVARMSRR
jgi:hypothetical protein